MKIRTNLTPKELARVSKGIAKAATIHAHDTFSPLNAAEAKLYGELDKNYDLMFKSLLKDIKKIIKD